MMSVFFCPVSCHYLKRMGKKDTEKKSGKWKQPSINDLQRAALGPQADSIPDEELEAFAAR
jgi:hypothetical protein